MGSRMCFRPCGVMRRVGLKGKSHTQRLSLQSLVKRNIWRWKPVLLNRAIAICGSCYLEKVLLMMSF